MKKRLPHKCFHVNFKNFFIVTIFKITSGSRLLRILKVSLFWFLVSCFDTHSSLAAIYLSKVTIETLEKGVEFVQS